MMRTDLLFASCEFALVDDQQSAIKGLVAEMLRVTRLNPTELARKAGLSPSTLTRFMNAPVKHTLSLPSLYKLGMVTGMAIPNAILQGSSGRRAPVVGHVGAGEQVFPVDDVIAGSGFERVEAPPASDEELVAVIVRGSSMFPVFWDGDVLFYARDAQFNRQDCLYNECIVRIVDGGAYVKRIMPGSTEAVYSLHSYNAPPLLDIEIEWAAPIQFHDMRRRRAKSESNRLPA